MKASHLLGDVLAAYLFIQPEDRESLNKCDKSWAKANLGYLARLVSEQAKIPSHTAKNLVEDLIFYVK